MSMEGCLINSDAEFLVATVVALICAVLLFAAGYWAGSSDSQPLHPTRDDSSDSDLPDPRKFKPPTRR